MTGAQGSPYLQPDQWQFTFGWRYQYSDHHFTGTESSGNRNAAGTNSQVKNTLHQLLFNFQYGWDKQTALSFSIPYIIAERSQGAGSDFPGERRYSAAHGIGDVNITARQWLLNVDDSPDTNIGIGLGIKFPTGEDNVQDSVKTKEDTTDDGVNNRVVRLRGQTVDQSIQPGDGGFGFNVDIEAFTTIGLFTPYLFASWLFTPQGENGVYTGRSKVGEEKMSIPDQYIGRAGTMFNIEAVDGLSVGIGVRNEGQPAHDPIGKDHGFRRPGYVVSIEPSLVYVHGKDVFSLAVPRPVVRARTRSDADQRSGGHGDAAFADYLILFSWSRRF